MKIELRYNCCVITDEDINDFPMLGTRMVIGPTWNNMVIYDKKTYDSIGYEF